jgi:hypothetical protein
VGNRRVVWNGGKSGGMARSEIDILAPIFTIDSQTWILLQRKYLRRVVNMAVVIAPILF